MSLLAKAWPALLLMAIVVVASRLAWAGDVVSRDVTLALIHMVVVVGLFSFIGTSGVFSFGHIAFMAIGAYVSGLLSIPTILKSAVMPEMFDFIANAHASSTVAILAGGVVAAAFALVLSIPLMRLSGIAASLATFSLLIIVNVVADNWKEVTNGSGGVAGVPTVMTADRALLWALGAIAIAALFKGSRVGLRLRASREDDVAARSVGVGVRYERRIAFVLSAFIVGCGGGMFAQFIGSFTADSFYLTVTFLTVVMLVVGGMNSLSGAVIGTIFIAFVSELLLRIEAGVDIGPVEFAGRAGLQEVILAGIMLLVLALRPDGLTGGREIVWPRTPDGRLAWRLPWARREHGAAREGPAERPIESVEASRP
jgi:branched-chain amino acid transport system permease protein